MKSPRLNPMAGKRKGIGKGDQRGGTGEVGEKASIWFLAVRWECAVEEGRPSRGTADPSGKTRPAKWPLGFLSDQDGSGAGGGQESGLRENRGPVT